MDQLGLASLEKLPMGVGWGLYPESDPTPGLVMGYVGEWVLEKRLAGCLSPRMTGLGPEQYGGSTLSYEYCLYGNLLRGGLSGPLPHFSALSLLTGSLLVLRRREIRGRGHLSHSGTQNGTILNPASLEALLCHL